MTRFKKGDNVTWSSQAGGVEKRKFGTVVIIVPARNPVAGYSDDAVEMTGARGLDAPGLSRDHESYIVHVPTKNGRSNGKLYWPVVKKLQLTSEHNPYDG